MLLYSCTFPFYIYIYDSTVNEHRKILVWSLLSLYVVVCGSRLNASTKSHCCVNMWIIPLVVCLDSLSSITIMISLSLSCCWLVYVSISLYAFVGRWGYDPLISILISYNCWYECVLIFVGIIGVLHTMYVVMICMCFPIVTGVLLLHG